MIPCCPKEVIIMNNFRNQWKWKACHHCVNSKTLFYKQIRGLISSNKGGDRLRKDPLSGHQVAAGDCCEGGMLSLPAFPGCWAVCLTLLFQCSHHSLTRQPCLLRPLHQCGSRSFMECERRLYWDLSPLISATQKPPEDSLTGSQSSPPHCTPSLTLPAHSLSQSLTTGTLRPRASWLWKRRSSAF